MTYRQDADIPLPYGIFKKLERPLEINYDEIWGAKRKSTVWLVSNCVQPTGRMELANAMKAAGLEVRRS